MCVGTYKKAGSADFSFSTTPPAVNGECKMSDSKADTCTTPYTGGAYYTSATYSADYLAQTGGRGTPKPGSAEPAK